MCRCRLSLVAFAGLLCVALLVTIAAATAKPDSAPKNKEATPPQSGGGAKQPQQQEVPRPQSVPRAPPAEPTASGAWQQTVRDVVREVHGVISSTTSAALTFIPPAARAHLLNARDGALSVFYGPVGYLFELRRTNNFWGVKQSLFESPGRFLQEVYQDFHANVLRRLEFSVGSSVAEGLLFLFLASVVRRTWLRGTLLRRRTHEDWLLSVALAAVPVGLVMDVAAIVGALASAPADSFLLALFAGKLLRPYVVVYSLWTLRAAAACVSCSWLSAAATHVISFLKAWTPESGGSAAAAASTTSDELLSIVFAAAVISALLALSFPTEPRFTDEPNDNEDEQK